MPSTTSSININSVPSNSKVYINGFVDFCRITSHIDGEELAADNARKVAMGTRGTDKPHTRISISNCSIDYADKDAPTIAEQFIAERLYLSTAHPERNQCYTAANKSRNLPAVYCRDNIKSKTLEPVTLTGELMQGVPVTIVLRFFSTNQNAGVSLDTVIVNEKPVKCYTGTNRSSEAALAERGFEIAAPSTCAPSVDDVRAQLNAQPAPIPAPAPTAAPAAVAPAPAATSAVPSATNLPTPPAGYMYDENLRIVPIPNQGGIKL